MVLNHDISCKLTSLPIFSLSTSKTDLAAPLAFWAPSTTVSSAAVNTFALEKPPRRLILER